MTGHSMGEEGMKPKLTTERKIELMREANRLIDRCNFLLDEAYKAHMIATEDGHGRKTND